MDVGSTELKIQQVTQTVRRSRLFAITSISTTCVTSYQQACVYLEGVPLMTYISFLLLQFFSRIFALYVCRNVWLIKYYIQRRGVTLKSNRSSSLKMGPIDRSYSRACVTITSSRVCFVSKQLASTSFRRQVLSTLLVQRWRGSSGWRFGLVVTRWLRSTQLRYVRPGQYSDG